LSLPCDDGSISLAVQTDDDVTLDEQGRYLCVELFDRNLNMASAGISVRVDLAAGSFEQKAMLRPESCSVIPTGEAFDCRSKPTRAPEVERFPYSFAEANFALNGPSNQAFGRLDDFAVEQTSSDGRWLLLSGNREEGDYVHRNLLAFDRLEGSVFPIPGSDIDSPPGWPEPLRGPELFDPSRERLGTRAGDFVAETSVRFAGTDRLVAGGVLLFLRERRAVRLPGDLAR
jgi:hypothetical protein